MLADLRHAWRSLRRAPVFVVVAVLSLGFGIGGATAVFSVVNAIHFQRLPWPDPERLAVVEQIDVTPGCEGLCTAMATIDEFESWAEKVAPLAELSSLSYYQGSIVGPQGPEYIFSGAVRRNFLSLLGVQPMLGRGFVADDDRVGALDVVILSNWYWRGRYDSDSSAIGKSLTIHNVPYQIIGVLPRYAEVGRPFMDQDDSTSAILIPLTPHLERMQRLGRDEPAWGFVGQIFARLRGTATMAELHAALDVLVSQPRAPQPRMNKAAQLRARLTPVREKTSSEFGGSFTVLLAAVAMVLLVACANLAVLFIARLTARAHEMQVRAALGAARHRLIRPLVLEGLLLAAGGALLGLAFGKVATRLIQLLPARERPYWVTISLDETVLAFCVALALIAGLAFSYGPAFAIARRLSRGVLLSSQRLSSASRTTSGARRWLVSLQIALTLVLLTSTGLLVQSYRSMLAIPSSGHPRDETILGALSMFAGAPGIPAMSLLEQTRLRTRIVDRLQQLPGIIAAATHGQMVGVQPGVTVDRADSGVAYFEQSSVHVVSASYNQVFRQRVISGRDFIKADHGSASMVAIVDEAAARTFFNRPDVVGSRIKPGGPTSSQPWLTIVGVVANEAGANPRRPANVFVSPPDSFAGYSFWAQASGQVSTLMPRVRAIVAEIAPTIPLAALMTVAERTALATASARLNVFVLSAFALVALMIAAIGVYGVVAYLTALRAREMGIRIALGATRSNVLGLSARSGLVMVGLGLVGGLAGSVAAVRLLRATLLNIGEADPLVFAAATALLAVITLIAILLPARRSTTVDPVVALRHE